MSRAAHYLEAEKILERYIYDPKPNFMMAALVHATLASVPVSVEEQAQALDDQP